MPNFIENIARELQPVMQASSSEDNFSKFIKTIAIDDSIEYAFNFMKAYLDNLASSKLVIESIVTNAKCKSSLDCAAVIFNLLNEKNLFNHDNFRKVINDGGSFKHSSIDSYEHQINYQMRMFSVLARANMLSQRVINLLCNSYNFILEDTFSGNVSLNEICALYDANCLTEDNLVTLKYYRPSEEEGDVHLCNALILLHKAGISTPYNRTLVVSDMGYKYLIEELASKDCLSQINIDIEVDKIKNKVIFDKLQNSFNLLSKAGILNDDNRFALFINPELLCALRVLDQFNALNQINFDLIIKHPNQANAIRFVQFLGPTILTSPKYFGELFDPKRQALLNTRMLNYLWPYFHKNSYVDELYIDLNYLMENWDRILELANSPNIEIDFCNLAIEVIRMHGGSARNYISELTPPSAYEVILREELDDIVLAHPLVFKPKLVGLEAARENEMIYKSFAESQDEAPIVGQAGSFGYVRSGLCIFPASTPAVTEAPEAHQNIGATLSP